MFSINPGKVSDADREAIRMALIAELDAINLYEQLAESTSPDVRKVLLDIAREEKTHVGEFQALLERYDDEQAMENVAGKKEVKELIGKEKTPAKQKPNGVMYG